MKFEKNKQANKQKTKQNLKKKNLKKKRFSPGVRDDFVLWFSGKQLGDYEAAFSVDSDLYGLEYTGRRFEWWSRCIASYEERWADVFPPEWSMTERIAEEFCSLTKLALQANLQQHRETLDVSVLVTALKQVEF